MSPTQRSNALTAVATSAADDDDVPGGGTVSCLHARARIADPGPELSRARVQALRGDATWEHRLERYGPGETLLVALSASAAIDIDGRQSDSLCFCQPPTSHVHGSSDSAG